MALSWDDFDDLPANAPAAPVATLPPPAMSAGGQAADPWAGFEDVGPAFDPEMVPPPPAAMPAPAFTDNSINPNWDGIGRPTPAAPPPEAPGQSLARMVRELREAPPDSDTAKYRRATGALEYGLERTPFGGAIFKSVGQVAAANALGRIRDGYGTSEDYAVAANYLARQEDLSERGLGRQVFDLASSIPGFAVEFAATGGSYSAAKTAAGKALGKGLGSQLASRAAGVAAQAATNPALIAERTTARTVPELTTTVDAGGRPVDYQIGESTGLLEALPAGFADAAIELGSERAGTGLAKATGLAALEKAVIGRWLSNPGRTTAMLQAAIKQGGQDGIVGEVLEERVGELARIAIGIEEGDQTVAGQLMLSAVLNDPERAAELRKRAIEQLTVEGLAFAAPGALSAASRAIPQTRVQQPPQADDAELKAKLDAIEREYRDRQAAQQQPAKPKRKLGEKVPPPVEPTTQPPVPQTPVQPPVVEQPQPEPPAPPQPTRDGEPPVPPGHVRFYHGGVPYDGGPRWLSQYREYAEGYAGKSTGGITHYVDIPADSPFLQKSFDDSGTNMRSPYVNFEAPPEIAAQLKPLSQSQPRKEVSSEAQQEEAQGGQGREVVLEAPPPPDAPQTQPAPAAEGDPAPGQGAQPTPPAAKYDFQTTFPEPTDAARRELVPGTHYPDPDDPDSEGPAGFFREAANEYRFHLAEAAGALDEADAIRKTGKRPGANRPLKNPEAEAKKLEDAAREAERTAEGLLAEMESIYGDEAVGQFREWAVSQRPAAQQEQPAATPEQPVAPPTPPAAETPPPKKKFGQKKQPTTAPAPEQPAAEKWKPIGVNSRGQQLFEDENGVRSVVEDGFRITEPVGIVPGGGLTINRTDRRYKTAEEVAAEEKPKEPAAKPVAEVIESPDLKIERQREERLRKAEEYLKPFTPGQRVKYLPTGEEATYKGMGKSGQIAVSFDNGTSISGLDADQIAPLDQPAAPPASTGPTQAELDALAEQMWDEETAPKPEPKKKLGQKPAPEANSPAAPPADAPTPAPKKSIGKKKSPVADKAATARSKAAESRKAFYDAVRDSIRNPNITSGVNPDLMRLAVKAAVDTVNEGVWSFAEYVETIYNEVPELIDTLAPYLEAAWRVAKRRDTTGRVSEAGRVADVLPAIQQKGGGSNVTDESSGGTETPVAGDRRPGAGRSERPDADDDGVLEGTSSEDVPGAPAAGDTGGPRESGGDAVHRPDAESDQPRDAGGRRPSGVRGRTADDAGERGPDDARDRPAVGGRANYHLTDPEKIVGGGQKAKFERNKRAIELAQELPLQNREPTPEELDILASYVGWGAFGQELFNGSWERPQPKPGWEEESQWLRETLGEAAWRDAQDSIINAHYTDPETVTAMWDMARRLGFAGGRVLEPSMGVGNFFSLMPRDLMEASQLTGIELDQTTASIARLLHPNANIQVKGYEESKTPDDFYDLIISNVPFANVKPADRRYERFNASLHNFFFLKAMDQVKPGGLVMFITSNTTMDGKANASRVRRELERHGDLVGAFRFPAGAFQRYAGTKVVADLIILRKRREGERPQPEAWHNIVTHETPSGGEVEVNEYWLSNPDHVFGTINFGRGTTTGRPGMIVDPPDDLAAEVARAIKQLPEGIANTEPQSADAARIQANDTRKRQNTVVVRNGEPLIVKGEHLVPLQEVTKWKQDRWTDKTVRDKARAIADLTKVRDVLDRVLAAQRESRDASKLRKELAAAYDSFVADHGFITDSDAVRVLIKAGDPMGNALAGLESKNADGTYSKRPIFTRETTRQKNKSTNLSIGDAYAVQRNESLDLDVDRIAELAKTTPAKVIEELTDKDTIYKTANGNWQPADMFLSGNVRRRAREIEAAIAEGVTGLERSLEAIKKVIPPDVPYTDIDANPGATWVPASDYAAFFGHLLNADPAEIVVERRTNAWRVPPGPRAFNKAEADTWGTSRVPFNRMLEASLNNETLKVYGKDEDGKPFLDETATAEANEKLDAIREEFRNWLWSSQERVGRLAAAYNETFNAYATPDYDGSHLSFEGLALELGDDPFSFRQHQANAVWRGMVTGKGLYAHEVGTGKTFTMGGLAIESRRLGLASKPMLLAHNANSLGVYRDIQRAYPAAKILYVDNLNAADRDRTMAQIALDDWDLVVVPHSLIDRIELRPETVEAMVRDEIAALDAAAWEAFSEDQSGFAGEMPEDLNNVDEDDLKRLKNRTAKELVKERMRLRARVVRAAQLAENANTVFFEDMGIDMLMVDEAHVFKKLPISTKQQLKGLNKTGSERGTSLMLLANAVRMNNNGRGVHLFTGTPITNALNEIYNMQRLVMAEEMDRDGIKAWDAWFNTFARSVSSVEATSGGTYDAVERLAAFINIPELRQVIGQYLDTVFADDMPEFAPRAQREGMTDSPQGRPYRAVHNMIGEMTDAQRQVTEDLRKRYTEFKKAKGRDKRAMMFTKTHNPLNIEQEGVKNALDPRFADQTADGDDPRLKVNRMLAQAMVHYYEHPQATQMIFMQTGFNDYADQTTTNPDGSKSTVRVATFNLAKDIKRKLVAAGVPEDSIAIFSDLSKGKRAEAAEKMRRGEIRFAIGSSETMGTGVNAQDYLVAMHHLDAPWMPGDLEQRNGRGWRQGNKWNTVHEYRYLTEGSHDIRRWQVLLTKATFIESFVRSKNLGRVLEGDATDIDDSGGGGDFSETLSKAAGDQRILMRAKLEKDVAKLERAERRHASNLQQTLYQVRKSEEELPKFQQYLDNLRADIESANSKGDDFRMVVGETTHNDRKDANTAIAKTMELNSKPTGEVKVGSFLGFDMFIKNKYLKLVGKNTYDVNPSVHSIESILRNLGTRLAAAEKKVADATTFIQSGKELAGRPFPRAADLQKKREKLAAIVSDMEANPNPSPTWLRHGAPAGTGVHYRGQEYVVSGHRGEDTVLLDGPDGIIPANYRELSDKYGTPIFPDDTADGDEGGSTQAFVGLKATGGGTGNIRMSPGAPTIPAEMNPSPGDTVSANEIVATMAKLFNVPIRTGRVSIRKALGIYKQEPQVIRTRGQSSSDLAVISHELAHHLDRTLDIRKSQAVTPTMKRELRALDYDPSQRRLFEGFAEFMRVYVTHDPADAQSLAPTFYDYLQKTWLPAHPDIEDKLERVRALVTRWRRQGAAGRVDSAISETGVAPGPVQTRPEWLRDITRRAWDQTMRTVWDENYVLRRADEALREKGGLKPGDMPMADLYAVLSRASPGMAERAISEGVYTIDGERVGGSLQDALKDIKEAEALEFRRFLYARHALEVYDKKPKMNPGISREDAQHVVDEIAADRAKFQRYSDAADAVTSYARSLLEVLVDAGVITEQSAEKMRKAWERYVPLSRAMEPKKSLKKLGPVGGLIDITSPVMRRHGSGRQVVDPIAMLVRQTQWFYNVAARKRIEQEFIRHFDPKLGGTEGLGGWLERVPPNRLPTRINLAEVWPAIADALEKNGIAEELGFDREMLDELGDAVAQDYANIWRPDYSPVPGKHISRVVMDGQPVLYEWNADLYEAMKGQTPATLPWFARFMAMGVSALKMGATKLNPAFAAANVARDWWTLQHQSQFMGPLEGLVRPFGEVITYAMSELAENGILKGQPDAVVKLWKQAGGKLATRYGMDRQGIENMRRKALSLGHKRSLKEKLILPIATLEEIINVSEVGPRLAEFVAALKDSGYERRDGKIVEAATGQEVDNVPLPVLVKAMRASQEVTVDFGRRGAYGKWADQFVPFVNAALQSTYTGAKKYAQAVSGVKKLGKGESLAGGDKRILIAMASSAAATIAYWLLRSDDDDYKEEEDWLKYGYWTFTDDEGKPILKVPKGYEYSLVPNMVESILNASTSGKSESLVDAMKHEAKNRIPINGPAVVGPLLEAWANYDIFREKPIENQRMQGLRPGDRATPYNTALMKAIGNFLNVSPAKMEHVVDQMTGGGYRRFYGLGERGVGSARNVINGEPVAPGLQPADIPFAGAFTVRKDYAASIDEFYTEKDRIEQEYNSAKLKGPVPHALADRFHTLEEYAELMQAIRAPIRDEQDRDKRFAYEKYIVGLSRAALNREPLDRYPNPLKADAADMPREVAEARRDYVGRIAKRRQMDPPKRKLGESAAKFRERVEHFHAMRRRSVLP